MLRLYILVVPSSSGMGDPHAVANIGGFSCPQPAARTNHIVSPVHLPRKSRPVGGLTTSDRNKRELEH